MNAHNYPYQTVPGTRVTVRMSPGWVPCDPDCPGWAVFDCPWEIPAELEDFEHIERCDACDRFYSDDDAALYAFKTVVSHFRGGQACPSWITLARTPRTQEDDR